MHDKDARGIEAPGDVGAEQPGVSPDPFIEAAISASLASRAGANTESAAKRTEHGPDHADALHAPHTMATRQGLSLRGNPIVTGLIGFVAGAVFWHLVGFWSLVTKLVFSGPRDSAVIATQSVAPGGAAVSSTESNGEHRWLRSRSQISAGDGRSHLSRTALGAQTCKTLTQEQPGGPLNEVPCPLGTPAKNVPYSAEELIADYGVDAHASQPRASLPSDPVRGGTPITTGSIATQADQLGSVPTRRSSDDSWATTLDVGPAIPAGQ